MDPAPPPQIDTPWFTLRCWSAEDTALLRTALEINDAHLRAWIPWVVDGRIPGQTLQERLERHREAFEAGTDWSYGVFDSGGTEVLGGCGLHPRVGPGAIEIGYWISVNHTGRGLATRATEVLTRLAFASPDIERVDIKCAFGNVASGRVPARLGFRISNHLPADEHPAPDTLMIWQITRAEYNGLQNQGG